MENQKKEKKTSVGSNCSDSGISTCSSLTSDDEDDCESATLSNAKNASIDDLDKWSDDDFPNCDSSKYSTSPRSVPEELKVAIPERPSPQVLRNQDVRGLVELLRVSRPHWSDTSLSVAHDDRKADLLRQMSLAWS